MITLIDVERAAEVLAEARVAGSTRPGGHYHLSEAWRAMIRRQASAGLEAPVPPRPVAVPAPPPAA